MMTFDERLTYINAIDCKMFGKPEEKITVEAKTLVQDKSTDQSNLNEKEIPE